jgi:hypothetical protein
MPAFILGDTVFDTKGAACEYIRKLLWDDEIGARVQEPGATDLSHLVKRHPEYLAKCGIGIDHFSVRDTRDRARAFEIVRTDGSRVEFSYKKCLEPPLSFQARISKALRDEVEPDIQQWKDEYFIEHADDGGCIRCTLTGAFITFTETESDHTPPYTFANIRNEWVASRAGYFKQGDPTVPVLYGRAWKDRKQAEDWREFHRQRACIRYISKSARARDGIPDRKATQLLFKGLEN